MTNKKTHLVGFLVFPKSLEFNLYVKKFLE